MREIKFRVWDKINNRMIFKPKKSATIIPVLDFNGNLGVMDTYKNWHWHGIVPENEYELMFFTGSHDKNGKEIYEGDIVKARDVKVNGQDKFYICEVKWMPTGWYAMSYKDLVGTEHYLSLNILETEVIGNIYENPELLEVVDC